MGQGESFPFVLANVVAAPTGLIRAALADLSGEHFMAGEGRRRAAVWATGLGSGITGGSQPLLPLPKVSSLLRHPFLEGKRLLL